MAIVFLLMLSTGSWHNSACKASAVESSDKPIIGINMEVTGKNPVEYSIQAPYVEAVVKAGGIPVVIPPMSREDLQPVLSEIDGILMIGGDDYPPSTYGQKPRKSIVLMAKLRSKFDLMLVREVLKRKSLPFLGICAGCQALSIGSKGTLVQDIPTQLPESKVRHASPGGWQVGFNKHTVRFTPESKLSRIYSNQTLTVVTSHHQCVDQTGSGLQVAARAPDGVIEAIESNADRFIIGIQWHPERDFTHNKQLFGEFIAKSKSHRQARKQ